MADRIINANILKGKPKITFSANNIIKSVDVAVSTITIFYDANAFSYKPEIKVTGNPQYIDRSYTLVEARGQNRKAEQWYYNFSYIFTPTASLTAISTSAEYATKWSIWDNLQAIPINIMNLNSPIKDSINLNISSVGYRNGTTTELPELYLKEEGKYQDDYSEPIKVEVLSPYSFRLYGKIRIKTAVGFSTYHVANRGGQYHESILDTVVIKLSANTIKKDEILKRVPTNAIKSDIILPTSELMQTDTTINGIPIGQHIANDILSQYKNGKATMTCSVNISDGTPLFVVGEIAKVYGFDGKSVSRNRDGTDKRFKITSAEWRWAGQETQNLEMVEVIE